MKQLRGQSTAVLITEAPRSAQQEFAGRRRRYLIMMAGRAFCVIGAVLVYNASPWLAAALLIGAAVLPWSAVLIANNRPAKQAVRFRRFLPGSPAGPRELTSADDNRPGRSGADSPPAPEGHGIIDV